MRYLEWNMNDALQTRFEKIQEFTDLPLQHLEQLVNNNRDDL